MIVALAFIGLFALYVVDQVRNDSATDRAIFERQRHITMPGQC